jgi:glycosyltransferase involved in cell wall biosynthesis
MFVGKLSYNPNSQGIDHFLKYVWPIIIKEIPQVHFNIIGFLLSEEKKRHWESHKGVNVIGFTEDLVTEYQKNNIIIVPIYLGGGTNIKVIEAMYMSKACVISQYASRGFEDLLIDGENILIAENENDFASKIIQLLKDPDLSKHIGVNAKKALKDEYSYDNFCKTVQQILN